MMRPDVGRSVIVGLLGAGIALLVVARVVTGLFGGDPAGLLRASVAGAPLVEQELGREIPAAVGQGHDGTFFFFLAMDPFIEDVQFLDRRLDDNDYRAGRILYPWLASAFGLVGPETILWMLPVINIAAVGIGTAALGLLASRRGLSTLFGLAFAVNLGVFFELAIDGASILGFAMLCLGLLAIDDDRELVAGAFFALSVLARETMILGVLGVVLYVAFLRMEVRSAVKLMALSVGPRLLWEIYLRLRFAGVADPFSGSDRNLDLPMRGIIEAVPVWLSGTILEASMIGLTFLLCGVVVWKAVAAPGLLSWGTAGFALLPAVVSIAVSEHAFDLTRVVMPALSAAIIVLVGQERQVDPDDSVIIPDAERPRRSR